jgi:branched-chain amino acid transport system ATP-binding protein
MPEAILAARGVSKRFGGLKALDSVDLEVFEGEIFGVIGPTERGRRRSSRASSAPSRPPRARSC